MLILLYVFVIFGSKSNTVQRREANWVCNKKTKNIPLQTVTPLISGNGVMYLFIIYAQVCAVNISPHFLHLTATYTQATYIY